MKIDRDLLLNSLSLLEPGLAKKEIIEQAVSFIFKNDRIITYNDNISVSIPFQSGITTAVIGSPLLSILKKIKQREIELQFADNMLYVIAGKSRTGIKCTNQINPIIDELSIPQDYYALPPDFNEAVGFCLLTVNPKDEFIFRCIHISNGIVESTDKKRLTRYHLSENTMAEDWMLIPETSAKSMSKYKFTSYAIKTSWIHLRTDDDILFSFRTLAQDEFPNLSSFIQTDGIKVNAPAELSEILNKSLIFAKEQEEPYAEVTIENNEMKINCKGDSGFYEDATVINYNGARLSFCINPSFLNSMTKLLSSILICNNCAVLLGDKFEHVVLFLTAKEKK